MRPPPTKIKSEVKRKGNQTGTDLLASVLMCFLYRYF